MRANVTSSPVRKGKRRLLSSCAIGAGMMALAYGGPALAQVQANPVPVNVGAGSSVSTSGKTTTVTVTQAQSIYNWVPTDTAATGGDINLLPSDSFWNFVGPGNYTVLNRFVNGAGGSLSRQIALNGQINSVSGAVSGVQGGNIWFYNAGGILIGSTGVINVGSLVLTTNDITTTGGLFGPGGTIRFRGASGSTSAVTIANGASVNIANAGSPGSSYMALVAPRVVQSGFVGIDGSAAYVGAEQADIRINGGLFDINVLVGAEGGNVITHTGVTTGPEQQAAGPAQRIYMVAIPKNVAVGMLVSGQVGYQDGATTAITNSAGAIVLSAGYNVSGGTINATPVNATPANISVGDVIFRSNITAHASGAFVGQPLATVPAIGGPVTAAPPPHLGRLIIQGNGTFTGDASSTININTGRQMAVTGNLVVQSGGVGGAPGSAAVNINGGLALTGGSLTVSAPGSVNATTGASQGGTASLSVTNAGVLNTQGLSVSATGTGGVAGSGSGGNGTGGTASITVSGTGSTLSASSIGVDTSGSGGGFSFDSSSGAAIAASVGGNGQGGTSTLTVQNGASLTATGGINVTANGAGELGTDQSGNGTGGTARITIGGAGTTVDSPFTAINAVGVGGGSFSRSPVGTFFSTNGGDGTGGTAELIVSTDPTSTLDLGAVGLSVSAFGGGAGNAENTTGGDAFDGNANVTIDGTGSVQVADFSINARADGGSAVSTSGDTAFSGNARGGNINLTATGGATLNVNGGIVLDADGAAQGIENAGSGTGGNVSVSATSDGDILVSDSIFVYASGGSQFNSLPRTAGNGTGGTVSFLADTSGTIQSDNTAVIARGTVANVSQTNGVARGGTVTITALNGGLFSTTSDGSDFIDVGAQTGYSQSGGSAFGGDITVFANEATINLAAPNFNASGVSGGALSAEAATPTGTGGNIVIRTGFDLTSQINLGSLTAAADGRTQAFVEGSGGAFFVPAGNGQGGTISFEANGGAVTAGGTIRLSADGYGGVGPNNTARGGTATFTQIGGTVDVGNLFLSADGFAGSAIGLSGDGFGGLATINFNGGVFTGGSVAVSAGGEGGAGYTSSDFDTAVPTSGNGGNGFGGTATINVQGDAQVSVATIAAYANGVGGLGGDYFNFSGQAPGAGGVGGQGYGGNAVINLTSGSIDADAIVADAGGFGGSGGSVLTSSSSGTATGFGVGGDAGLGQGGTATINVGATTLTISESVTSQAIALGGSGGIGTTGGNGGAAFGGVAQAIVTDYDAGVLVVGLDASATGGDGGYGSDGNGGRGGDATGGSARIEAIGLNANIIVSQDNFLTTATGGNGGNADKDFFSSPTTAGRGGDGGSGIGGSIEIFASDGGTIGFAPGRTGVIGLRSIGNGGNGGRGADNPNTITLPGRDGIPGTPDDIVQTFFGGDGGFGGAGIGGTVYLRANGGTITTDGAAMAISVNGISGQGGDGGMGSAGPGNCCSIIADSGGRVIFEALATPTGPGSITLGNTVIDASGTFAGRIQMVTDGSISMTSLLAEANGFANPTNNDTDEAPAGIFLAATGGTIGTTGDMTLRTGSSVGAYAQAGGQVSAGGNLLVEAGDQVDLRHEFRGENAAATILAGDGLTIRAGNSISGAPGTLLSAANLLALETTGPNGTIGVDRLDGGDISISTAGAASVEHAEADDDFTATVGTFRTGLNSIITGGDIVINAVGTVDLGNSTAGGLVFVEGQSIAFNTVNAGTSVSLRAQGFGAGDGVFGTDINAGGDVSLNGRSIGLLGTVQTDQSFSANAFNGAASLGLINAGGSIFASSNGGDLTGTFRAGGNVSLRSDSNISGEADAAGGYTDANGITAEGYILIDAGGNVTLTNSSAATMIGIRSGGSTTLTNAIAGEDVFVLAGTTAALDTIVAGDDIRVQSAGNMIVNTARTTGAGPDGRSVVYAAGASAPVPFLQIQTTPADLSNITLIAPTANISASNLSAFNNLSATAGGTITGTGTLAAGGSMIVSADGAVDLEDATAGSFVQVSGESIVFNSIDAGSTVDLNASGTVAGAEGVRGGAITAGDSVFLNGNNVAVDTVQSDGFLSAIASGGDVAIGQATITRGIGVSAQGDITGNYAGGEDVFLSAGGDIIASARAIGDGGGSSSGTPTRAGLYVDAGGNVVLTNSAATGMFGVNAGGSAAINGGNAGEDMLVLAGTSATLSNITVGDDLDVRAAGNISATTVSATGTGPDANFLTYMPGSGFTIMQGEGSSGTNGSDITLTSTNGSIAATTLSAGDDIVVQAANGAIALNGATTQGLGVTGGGSNISTQGGATTLSGLNAFDDISVASTGALNVTGTVRAGRNIVMDANAVTLADIPTSGELINTVSAGGNVAISSATGITGGALSAGNNLTLTAGGAIDIVQGQTGDGGALTLSGVTGIDADQLISGGITTLTADNGAIRVGNLTSLDPVTASANSLDIGTNGPVEFLSLTTDVGDATIRSNNRLIITNATVAGVARFRNTGEHMIVRSLTAGSAEFDANEMLSMTNVSVTGDLNADAGTIIAIDGTVTGRNISLASADIDITASGRVGTAGVTQGLTIANNDEEQQTFVGGTGTRNGFHIDAAEMARLFGTDILIFAPEVDTVGGGSVGSSAPPDVIVDSFTMTGGGPGAQGTPSNLGANGSLTIQTPGKMRVIGNVQLTGLTDDNALNLFADDALEVILGQGTVRLLGANNAPGGVLNMASDDIIVATSAAITDVGNATTIDAINTRLAQNDGVTLDEGALFARRIAFDVVGGVYVQNSGAGTGFGQRRGLTFGAGGLDVVTQGPSRIVINGVHLGPNGQVTGLDTIPLLTIAGSPVTTSPTTGSLGFDPLSTFNGCVIANVASCSVRFDGERLFPVQDVINDDDGDGEDTDGSDGGNLPSAALITMRDLDPLTGEPLLDDPVTGAGNDDLWTPVTDTPTENP